MLDRIFHKSFHDEYLGTVGVNLEFKTINNIELVFWDTASQQRLKTIPGHAYREADLFLYCLSAKKLATASGNNINNIIASLKQADNETKIANNSAPILLTITKTDLVTSEQQTNYNANLAEIENFLGDSNNSRWIKKPSECSAKTGKGIEELTKTIEEKQIENSASNSSKLSTTPQKSSNFSKWLGYISATITVLALAAIATLLTTTIITATPLIIAALAVTAFCCIAITISTTLYQQHHQKSIHPNHGQTLAQNQSEETLSQNTLSYTIPKTTVFTGPAEINPLSTKNLFSQEKLASDLPVNIIKF